MDNALLLQIKKIQDKVDVKTSTRASQASVDSILTTTNSTFNDVAVIKGQVKDVYASVAPDSIDILNGSPYKTASATINSTYNVKDITNINSSDLKWSTALNVSGPLILSELKFKFESNYSSYYYNSFYRMTLNNTVYTGYCKSYHWSGSSSGTNTASITFSFDGFQPLPVPASSGAFPKNINNVASRSNTASLSYKYYSDRGMKLDKFKIEFAIGYSSVGSTNNQATFSAKYELL